MKRREIRRAVVHERETLVEDLRRLDMSAWDHPSLCEGWKVRDVIGHLIFLDAYYRHGFPFLVGLLRHRFRVNRFLAQDAKRRAAGRPADELVGAFEATAYERTIGARLYPWPAIPLAELVIHGLDIRRPLGLAHSIPMEHFVAVADLLVSFKSYPWGSPRRRDVTRYEATDHGWSRGEGQLVRAPLETIVMTLAGR